MPTPALAFRFAREFRRLVEKPRHLGPVLFGNREPYLREYDLLAVEVGQSRPGSPELAQRVGKPYPSENLRTALQRDRPIGEQLVECPHLLFAQRRQAFSDRALGPLRAYAEDTQHRLGRFLLEVKDRAGEIVATADAENSRGDPIPPRRALRAKLVVNPQPARRRAPDRATPGPGLPSPPPP